MNVVKRVVTGWRSGIAMVAIAGFVGLAMVAADAEAARRFGGGKSFGRQSQNVERQQMQPPATGRCRPGGAGPAGCAIRWCSAAAACPQPLDGPARRSGGWPGDRCAAVCVRPERRVRADARAACSWLRCWWARPCSSGACCAAREIRRRRSAGWSRASRPLRQVRAGSTTAPPRPAPAASRRPWGRRARLRRQPARPPGLGVYRPTSMWKDSCAAPRCTSSACKRPGTRETSTISASSPRPRCLRRSACSSAKRPSRDAHRGRLARSAVARDRGE